MINGRKYEDRERLITEYLPISFKERVKQIYFTTYIFLVPAVLVDFTFRYTYYQASIIEYVYVLLAVIIISNLAIIQMILTKRSFWNFIAMGFTTIRISCENNNNNIKWIVFNNI